MSLKLSNQNQEEELKKMRDGLNALRQEEVELEQKVEAGKAQLEQLGKSLSETQTQLAKVRTKLAAVRLVRNGNTILSNCLLLYKYTEGHRSSIVVQILIDILSVGYN
jgi:predicted  nucleic acid-binding Zn-ribbon protein